jgi:hypothetical protein
MRGGKIMSKAGERWFANPIARARFPLAGTAAVRGLQSTFIVPKTFIGPGSLSQFEKIAPALAPKKRAFIITDKWVRHLAERVSKVLQPKGFSVEIWDKTLPEPPPECVKDGADAMSKFSPDLIIAVGGGSVIDAAKSIWIGYERPDLDLLTVTAFTPLGLRKKAFFIAIPTTSGTGSEGTNCAVLTDTELDPPQKMIIASSELVPDVAILDPHLPAGMSPKLTAGTGLDALAHAVGSYISHWSNDYTDALGMKAIKLTFKYLPRAYHYPKDMEARTKMHIAANMAGLAFTNGAPGLDHAMGHSFGKIFGVHHGISVGLFLPFAIEFQKKATDKYIDLARNLGIDAETDEEYLGRLIERTRDLLKEVDGPLSIKELGITEDNFNEKLDLLVEYAWNDVCTLMATRPVDPETYRKLFTYAYSGRDIDF